MCKLNTLCPLLDGSCTCSSKNMIKTPQNSVNSDLLLSILSAIKKTPNLLQKISNQSEENFKKLNELIENFPDPPLGTFKNRTQSQDNFSVLVLNTLPKKFLQEKQISILAEVVDPSLSKLTYNEPIIFQLFISSPHENKEEILLAETPSTGTVFFKKIPILQDYHNSDLAIRIKNRDDIIAFKHPIKFSQKLAKAPKKHFKKTE